MNDCLYLIKSLGMPLDNVCVFSRWGSLLRCYLTDLECDGISSGLVCLVVFGQSFPPKIISAGKHASFRPGSLCFYIFTSCALL